MSKYSKAYVEVLEILKYIPKEEYQKIPKEKIQFYKDNMDLEYKYTINPEIDLSKQNISEEANAIFITLYRDYFASEKQKEILEEILVANDKKLEVQKRKNYNPDDIFKPKQVEENYPVEIKKETFFEKLVNYIRKIFKRKS